ncbi:MAG: hypothetical protein ACMXX7_00270 [Candidatus Woesearchaeota archaeon]
MKLNKKGNALALFVLAIIALLLVIAFVPAVREVVFDALNIVFGSSEQATPNNITNNTN